MTVLAPVLESDLLIFYPMKPDGGVCSSTFFADKRQLCGAARLTSADATDRLVNPTDVPLVCSTKDGSVHFAGLVLRGGAVPTAPEWLRQAADDFSHPTSSAAPADPSASSSGSLGSSAGAMSSGFPLADTSAHPAPSGLGGSTGALGSSGGTV